MRTAGQPGLLICPEKISGSPAQVVMSNSFIKLVFLSEPFFLKPGLPQPDKYGIKPEYFFINSPYAVKNKS